MRVSVLQICMHLPSIILSLQLLISRWYPLNDSHWKVIFLPGTQRAICLCISQQLHPKVSFSLNCRPHLFAQDGEEHKSSCQWDVPAGQVLLEDLLSSHCYGSVNLSAWQVFSHVHALKFAAYEISLDNTDVIFLHSAPCRYWMRLSHIWLLYLNTLINVHNCSRNYFC